MHHRRSLVKLVNPTAGACPEEAAAIAAAIEQFIAETTPVRGPQRRERDRWREAALLEGVLSGPACDLAEDVWLNT